MSKKLRQQEDDETNFSHLANFVSKIDEYKAVFLLTGGTEVIGKIIKTTDATISVQEIAGRDEYTPIVTEIARSRIYAFKVKLEFASFEDDDEEFGEDD